MGLLDLPPELITLIVELIGIVELRTSTQYLLVSKLWYRAALPVFLSDLQISTIYLSSHDLERFPPQNSPLNDLIAEKVERLSIRFAGHPSKQIAQEPWHRAPSDTEYRDNDAEVEYQSSCDDWTIVGPVAATGSEVGRKKYLWHTEEHQLRLWRDRINTKLLELFDTVSICKNLKELSVKASKELLEESISDFELVSALDLERAAYVIVKVVRKEGPEVNEYYSDKDSLDTLSIWTTEESDGESSDIETDGSGNLLTKYDESDVESYEIDTDGSDSRSIEEEEADIECYDVDTNDPDTSSLAQPPSQTKKQKNSTAQEDNATEKPEGDNPNTKKRRPNATSADTYKPPLSTNPWTLSGRRRPNPPVQMPPQEP
ncbi:hypothetical protein ACLMJK_007778 [Lecanora helva]